MLNRALINTITSCISPPAILRVTCVNSSYAEYCFPLAISSQLLLSVAENDFQLDGYTVRSLWAIAQVEAVRGTYLNIHRSEGTLKKLYAPPVGIQTWKQTCLDLRATGELILAETEGSAESSGGFLIGKIERVGNGGVVLRCFDGDGVWDRELTEIAYGELVSITFGSRYLTTFAKYLSPFSE